MAKADAEITVGVDASAVERAMAVGTIAVREFAAALQSSIGGAAREVATSLANVALAAGKVNFAAQHQSVREFEASTAHLAVAMGRDLEGVRGSIESTGVAIGKRPQEVAQWTEAVGRLTYNFEGASKSIKGMSGLAAETGRSVQDYQGLAATLANVGKVTGDSTHAIGVMQAQAEKFGTIGGVAAFTDQIEALGPTLSHFAISSEQDFAKITAAAGALGKGLSPAAAERVQQGAFGAIQGQAMEWSRYLKRDITDEHGQVKNPEEVLKQIADKMKATYGKDAKRALQYQFGAETGAAMFNADFKGAAEAAGLAPSGKPDKAREAYLATDAGKREVADAKQAESSRALMGSGTALGRAADALQQWAAKNPITSTLVSTALTQGMGTFMQGFGNRLSKIMGGTGAGGGAGGLADVLTKGAGVGSKIGKLGKFAGAAGGVLGAAALGYEAGTLLDETLGISDWVSGTGGSSRVASADAAHDPRANAALSTRTDAIRRSNAALRASGLTGEERHTAEVATQRVLQSKDATSAIAFAKGDQSYGALYGELRKEGKSDEQANRLAEAVAKALQNIKIEVSTAPDAPTNVTAKATSSTAAGAQGHAG
jgi:hypothetical protein